MSYFQKDTGDYSTQMGCQIGEKVPCRACLVANLRLQKLQTCENIVFK